VTSFESLPHPSRSELRQFAELFAPLFTASSDTARREAVAALSQCPNVPAPVAFFIASQPIAVAAPFLLASPCLTNDALIAIARTQGIDHAHAIARRESLSPTVVDALVSLRYDKPVQRAAETAPTAAEQSLEETLEAERLEREEQLRQRIKLLAGHVERAENDRLGLRTISSVQTALLVRFARARETGLFAGVLADALSASRWLAERIMLDLSGRQLATTLKGLFMEQRDALFILQKIYSHLEARQGSQRAAEALWNELDADDCGRRVEAWRRADRYTHAPSQQTVSAAAETLEPQQTVADPAPVHRTSASIRRSVAGHRRR
jgi:uncharacterized protein (DUF2336 family)